MAGLEDAYVLNTYKNLLYVRPCSKRFTNTNFFVSRAAHKVCWSQVHLPSPGVAQQDADQRNMTGRSSGQIHPTLALCSSCPLFLYHLLSGAGSFNPLRWVGDGTCTSTVTRPLQSGPFPTVGMPEEQISEEELKTFFFFFCGGLGGRRTLGVPEAGGKRPLTWEGQAVRMGPLPRKVRPQPHGAKRKKASSGPPLAAETVEPRRQVEWSVCVCVRVRARLGHVHVYACVCTCVPGGVCL